MNHLGIDVVSKEISKYACRDDKYVQILPSITGIDVFSAMLITAEIVDVSRFSTPWKLVSYAGLAPSIRESAGKTLGRIIVDKKIHKIGTIYLPTNFQYLRYH